MDDVKVCAYCGTSHSTVCPMIRAMDFYESGQLRRVEFREAPPICQHRNRMDMSVSGLERWICKDCGFEFEKTLN